MTAVISFPEFNLAVRDFPGVTRDEAAAAVPVNYLVLVDLGTPLAAELPGTRARLARKLVALLKPNDRLTLWWASSDVLFGDFVHNQVIADPAKDIPLLLEEHITIDALKTPPRPLGELVAKANHLYVECSGRKEALVGYADIDGFWSPSAAAGLYTLMLNIRSLIRVFFLCEYSCGEAWSEHYQAAAGILRRILFYAKDQYEEQITFESAAREIAGNLMAEVNISNATPSENYGFVLFLYGQQPFANPCAEGDVVLLPAGVTQFAYFSDEAGSLSTQFLPQLDNSPLLWVALAYAELLDEDIDVEGMLTAMGDVYLGNQYVDANQSEDFCRFEAACLEAGLDPRCRYRQGITANIAALSSRPASEVHDELEEALRTRDELSKEKAPDYASTTIRDFNLEIPVFILKVAIGLLASMSLFYLIGKAITEA